MIKKGFGSGILMAWKVAAIALLPALAFGASGSAQLRNISIANVDGGLLVTLETSAPTHEKLFTLKNPHRVVVDLSNTAQKPGLAIPDGLGSVATIRTGVRPGGALRVVLELKSYVGSRAEWQPAFADIGDRFVIALGDKSFLASAIENDSSNARVANATPRIINPEHAPHDEDRDIIVAVDAGHGGKDPGSIGRDGTYEKTVVLAISRALAARINREPGMRAYLTRDDDYYVLHRDRMLRARKAKADIFLSVHADSIRDRTITGASVYVLSERGATSEAARWLAERENAADLVGGVSLDDKDRSLASVLLDLSQAANISASMVVAENVLGSLDRSVSVRKSKVQQAGFLVLKSPDIPSILVETAYISNPKEEAALKSVRHQKKLAEAIFAGVRSYFQDNPPAGTLFANQRRSQLAGVIRGAAGSP